MCPGTDEEYVTYRWYDDAIMVTRYAWDGGWQIVLPALIVTRGRGWFWFRVFGWGLRFTHRSAWLFSERNGYGCRRVGPVAISLLGRDGRW